MHRKLGKPLVDIRGLMDRLDACMLFVNEVTPESSRLEPLIPTPCPTLTRHITTEDAEASAAAAAADVDLLLGSTDDESRAFLPPDRTPFTTGARNTGGDAGPASALLQEEPAAQLAQMAGQLQRNAEHFSGTLWAD